MQVLSSSRREERGALGGRRFTSRSRSSRSTLKAGGGVGGEDDGDLISFDRYCHVYMEGELE